MTARPLVFSELKMGLFDFLLFIMITLDDDPGHLC